MKAGVQLGDVSGRVVRAEAEAQAIVARIRAHAVQLERRAQGPRLTGAEGEELPSRRVRDRHDQLRFRQGPGDVEPIDELALQRVRVLAVLLGGEADLLPPAHHGIETVEPGGVEGGAHEAHRAGRKRNPARDLLVERAEGGEPPGVTRAQLKRGGWHVQEARPLARHRVLVATAHIEGARARLLQLGRDGTEAVVAVDDHIASLGSECTMRSRSPADAPELKNT